MSEQGPWVSLQPPAGASPALPASSAVTTRCRREIGKQTNKKLNRDSQTDREPARRCNRFEAQTHLLISSMETYVHIEAKLAFPTAWGGADGTPPTAPPCRRRGLLRAAFSDLLLRARAQGEGDASAPRPPQVSPQHRFPVWASPLLSVGLQEGIRSELDCSEVSC